MNRRLRWKITSTGDNLESACRMLAAPSWLRNTTAALHFLEVSWRTTTCGRGHQGQHTQLSGHLSPLVWAHSFSVSLQTALWPKPSLAVLTPLTHCDSSGNSTFLQPERFFLHWHTQSTVSLSCVSHNIFLAAKLNALDGSGLPVTLFVPAVWFSKSG